MNQPSARSASVPNARFCELSAPRQALVRLCQSIDYGQIIDLHLQDGEPVFSPKPTVLLEVKLDADYGERPELQLSDFTLRDEICRLLARIDLIHTGRVPRIDVRAGLPWRVIIEAPLEETGQ